MLGFIILRHVNSSQTNLYWIECYTCIRKFYPDSPIMIVDDASIQSYIREIPLTNTIIVHSEFKGRGEILPYYYYLQHTIADTVVVVHDSTFIQRYIEFGNEPRFLWDFEHEWDSVEEETALLCTLDNHEPLLEFYHQKEKWYGCFGVMSVMTRSFLEKLEDKYKITRLVHHVTCRRERMLLERVFAVLVSYEMKMPKENCSLFGNIHKAFVWKYPYTSYLEDKHSASMIKVWSER